MIRKVLFFFLLIGFAISAKAQLSDLHYLPPLKQGQNNAGIRQQAIYLSTPEPTPFTVNVYRGTNPTPVDSYTISNVSPDVHIMSNGDNNIILVNNANTGIVLNNSGLRFESPSGNRFYVNYRGSSNAQSASLTSKGRVAMGTRFKWGGVPNLGNHPSKSNTLGIMATEDNTTIDLFGYDPGCEFRVGNDRAGITADTYQITLDANESFVFETYIGNSPTQAHEDGWIGASVVSDKNIVISNGSINFGRQMNATNRDAGIDQPVPENRLGKEYVFVRGNGNTNGWTEFPLIIGIADNTQIFINGSATPITTIDNGDYFQVPSTLFSSNTVGANMLVKTSKDVYAYQCMAGSSQPYTQGLNFVAPVNCLLPDVMDNIPDIRNMAGTAVTGGLTIIAAVNTPDANISVADGNGAVALPASNPVAGSTDWKTFFIPNLNGNVSVQSTGPMAIGFFGYNGARGVAGYFSGFDTVPAVNLEIRGGTGCFVGSTIFEATGNFDAYQWYGDGVLIPGANSPSYAPANAGDYFVRGTKGPCTYDSQSIGAFYCDPDVVVNKTVDNLEITEGETAIFTIRVRNLGVGPLTNLQITDNIPVGLTLVSSFTIDGSWSGNTWNIGTLNGGEVAELELEVQADEIDTLPLLSLTNTAINSQDQVDANITLDHPSARITVHNDYDNDGVRDITDLDDDNDGVFDEDECENLSFNLTGGNSHNSSLISVENYLILDIFNLDNSFNLQINGTDIAGEIQFQNAPGNFARFFDGFGYGENGNPQVYTLTGSAGSPLLRVVIDQLGQFQLYGSKTSNGPLEPMTLTIPAATFVWNPSGNNSISINQAITGATNMSGVLLTAGCDTDADGTPDQLDLDSDGDGCSDANEFYKEETADGGDGGEYGTGDPVVDANDGTVNAASYVKVFSPEILLGNTVEDLGGMDINGQALDLGDTFEYVLRFQNTGDDNAINFTIRDILPNNITLDAIEIPIGSGITSTHDSNTNTIVFTVPNNLVEIGDPIYTIRIRVTLAANCSSFVDACSSELENRAFVTYQGMVNNSVFTDENGSNSITACPGTPEVARNSILNGLAGCNEARTVQLCGDDAMLTAGQGFMTYNWVLDTNGNGQVDASDTVISNGSSNTLIVTGTGDYIVEKSGNGTCPDLVELITVERFGTTQSNPIVDYFSQVNSDINPDNDIQGEIQVDCIDGTTQFPEIFLCGVADSALLQMNIPDAQGLFWELLDETSCTVEPDGCLNRNLSCTWNQVAAGSDFIADTSGRYRLSITYQNGCFSRFYFNVFKNELALDVAPPTDILCNTPGNIRIMNVGAGYGFQLVDVTTSNIVVPFSANNGPNFDIAASGTYKVQVTQINPADGTPITGGCIFETEDIGIQEQLFDVVLSTTPADCNQLGTISVSALNALPNYSYELRLDDGSNGGLGSLVGSQPAVNDNTHIFSSVNPGNYIVVTNTQDGCSASRDIIVTRITELSLGAVTSENITCTPGIVNLTPAGGLPSPDYEMAIWSKDGTTTYTDEASVPDSEFQTTASFLFGDTGNPNREGDYVFIVKDGNGCFALSNSIRVEDLGAISISATNSGIVCADSSTASLTVSASGGTAPYQYSLDGGTNYQSTATFVNLPAGLYTITVLDSSSPSGLGCVETFDHEITQPFRLTASATILEDASCNPAGALVKIINANGGQAPYEYSINGGIFSGINESNLLPGDHQFSVKDALGCTFDMELTVPSLTTDPSFVSTVDYACNGQGTITVTPSNTTDFTYTYALNGTANTPSDNNVFSNVADGTQYVTVGFSSSMAPGQSVLFMENFGAGPTTQIGEIGPGYCYEPQDFSTTNCNLGPAGILVNGEYTVTNFVTNPVILRNPNDHTALTDGRFLAIDVSTLAGDKGILWARRNIEVLPNREITLSFWAYNLIETSGTGNNPEVFIELVDGAGTVISSIPTAEIPKNNNADDWHSREVTFDPGANTTVDIVLRSNLNSDFGNDLVLDDIQAYQLPEVCEKTADLTIVVEDNKEFSATFLSTIDPTCNGSVDGAIRFEVSNFDSGTGFEYSTDDINWTTSLVSPVTTNSTLGDGTHTVFVRRINDISCKVDFTTTLNEPTVIVPSLTQTAGYTCFNTGGTLEASATGGTPGYQYQIEDTANTIIRAFQINSTFVNVPAGDYLVRVQDAKLCEVISTTPITINAPLTIDFDLTTTCYDGLNNGSITVMVNTGNGDYLFRQAGSPAWQAPTPTTSTTYTFTGLSEGSYDIEVSDGLGCVSSIETITIAPTLTATLVPVDVSTCADGSITVNATGGDGNYVYAYVSTSATVQDTDFSTSNTFTVTSLTVDDYNVYVRDNGGISPRCEYQETVTIQNAPVLAFTAVPTAAICFGGSGSIDVSITSGRAPFTYQLVDVDHGTSNQTQNSVVSTTRTFFNLTPGNYDVIITDGNGCTVTVSAIAVEEPDELTAMITGITPANCTGDINDFGFGFSAYPTTLGTIEFSADAGATWLHDNSVPGTSDQLTGYLSGDTVYPSMRTVDGSDNTICQTDLPPYIIPYPLDDLDITILPLIVNCNELQVTVRGQNGTGPYLYTYTEDPANFDPNAPDNGWFGPFASGVTHTFPGLTPGRTYSFYVRDSSTPAPGCVRQSSVNVNDEVTNPMEITSVYEPSCNGANNGEITYTITDADGSIEPLMSWTLYDINDNPITNSGGNILYNTTVSIPNLSANEFYIVVTQVDAGGTIQCTSASENLILEELDAITATLSPLQNISCEAPGLIGIENIQGGGGTFTYTVTGPAPFVTITGTLDNPIEVPVNSPAGTYNVQITDQYGCSSAIMNVALSLAENPVITSLNVDNCGVATTVTIHGSSPAFPALLFSIDGGTTYFNNAGIFSNVAPGTYTAVVKNGAGCTVSQAFTVELSIQATATLVKSLGCGLSQEAEIVIEVTDGSGVYEYEILDSSSAFVVARQALSSNPTTELITLADTYTVNVYDMTSNPDCRRPFTIAIPIAIVPDFTAVATDVSCFGYDNGAIVLTQVNNGNNPLSYSLTPNNGNYVAATATYENLPPDTYEVTAIGPNGCETIISNIVIDLPNAITFALPTITPFQCSSGNSATNATISINTTSIGGGSGTFTNFEFEEVTSGVIQNGTDTNYVFTDLAGGDVIVRVIDDKGCEGEVTVHVPEYDQLNSATVSVDDPISCDYIGEDVHIVVTALNLANYEFRLLPTGTFQPSNVFTDLQPGTHTFAVRNTNTLCEITVDHVIAEPNTFDVATEILTDAICFGDDGSVRFTITDTTYGSDFTLNIKNTEGTPTDESDDTLTFTDANVPLGQTPAINIPAGSYLVEVIQNDLPTCPQVRAFTIATPTDDITLTTITTTDVGCNNDQGSANIIPIGGLAPYEIALTNTTTGTIHAVASPVNANLFQALGAGLFSVEVTDALGCTRTFLNAFELLVPDPISGSISATDLACEGDNDAIVEFTLNPRNVISNYNFILNTYSDISKSTLLQSSASQASPTFINQSAGFYTISVLDDMGCTFEDNIPVEIMNPTEVNGMLLTTQSLSCLADAELELTATGGTGPYMWSMDGINFSAMNEINAANTHLFPNVNAGTYEYFVQDSYNCISILSNEIRINALEDLTLVPDLSAAVINCDGQSTAVIQVAANGGLGDYQYALFSDQALSNEIRPYQASGTFADLPQGIYYVNVQSEDCELISEAILIEEPEELNVTPMVTDISCNGEDDGKIEFDIEGGSGDYQFAISPNLDKFVDVGIFENLSPGDYTAIAQDSMGCLELVEFTITEPERLTMTLSATPEICRGEENGSITVTVTDGTGTPPYSTAIDSDNDEDFVVGRLTFENLTGGDHLVFVKDANGCLVDDIITIGSGANLNATPEIIYECTGDTPNNRLAIVFEDETVANDLLYGLDSSDPNDLVLEPNFENLTPGDHYLYMVHANGCTRTIDIEVAGFEPLQLSLEQLDLNEITANAIGGREGYRFYFDDQDNGEDNTFYIKRTDTYSVKVVDQNGCETTASIFMEFIDIEIPNFFTPDGDGLNDFWIPRNIVQFPDIFIKIYDRYGREVYRIQDTEEGWNGLYQEADLPTGDYWYVIQLNGEEDDREFVGNFTLYR